MPVIGLLTDFGTRDPYVATMKGVIAARSDASIVDLSHDLTPFDIFEAAWFLREVLPWYPRGGSVKPATVIVAVIDPGVGSSRRIVAADLSGLIAIAPDNGLLSLHVDAGTVVHSVENESLFLPQGSTTFHGRDRFAPVAAALAEGLPLASVGPRIDPATLVGLDYARPEYGTEQTRGTVVSIDRFGNIITDLEATRIDPARSTMHIGPHRIDRVASSYSEVTAGPFMIIGSRGLLEVSVAGGSAADVLQARRFDQVVLDRRGA